MPWPKSINPIGISQAIAHVQADQTPIKPKGRTALQPPANAAFFFSTSWAQAPCAAAGPAYRPRLKAAAVAPQCAPPLMSPASALP